MIKLIGKILLRIINKRSRALMIKDLKELFANNNKVNNIYQEGEDLFLEQWKQLDKSVSPMAYRFYSNFIGNNINIVPADTARQFIEPVLNYGDCEKFYSDKNSFCLFINPDDMPKTLFRSMGYKYYDGEYNAVLTNRFHQCFDGYDKVIVKPAKDLGGHGITFFERKHGELVNSEDIPLSLEFLDTTYKTDYLIQECFEQSDYISQFNPTSVNTIRANTYRDVNTGEIHILGTALRIGAKGSKVDNATSGGVIIGIDDNGKLGTCAYDKYGREYTMYNDIDFGKETFTIPNFESIKLFAKKITTRLPHMRLLALDIVLDSSNTPKLIEVNCNNFSVKFLQLTKQPVFGEYTEDIIEYCKQNKQYLSIGIHKTLKK